MKINILTLFPDMFDGILNESILGRAVEKGILEFTIVDIRDFSTNKHRSVDDTPYGGGAGMVMTVQPIFDALDSLTSITDVDTSDNLDAESLKKHNHKMPGAENDSASEKLNMNPKKTVYMSPRGRLLDKGLIDEYLEYDEITILCGHYEGVDNRVLERYGMEEVSIGDYILTGGELPAMVLVDTLSRMVPGVLGSHDSHHEESIYSGLLEYPQYTKPRNYQGYDVPEVLFSGNHKEIHLWNYEQSLIITAQRRPDMFAKYIDENKDLTKEEKQILDRVKHDYICVTEE